MGWEGFFRVPEGHSIKVHFEGWTETVKTKIIRAVEEHKREEQ